MKQPYEPLELAIQSVGPRRILNPSVYSENMDLPYIEDGPSYLPYE